MDLTTVVRDAETRARERKPTAVNRDHYPVLSDDYPAPGGTVRVVTRASTGTEMVEYEPDAGRIQRLALAAIPAVGFVALSDEHHKALRELFPEEFPEAGEPSDN